MTAQKSYRGRPKSTEKRDAIMEAGTELFLDAGYAGVSMDRVAEKAGVSKQTVYSHFENKDALFAACVECRCTAFVLSEKNLDPNAPVSETLRDFAHRFSTMLVSPEAIQLKRVLCGNTEETGTLAQLFYDAGPMKTRDLLCQYLRSQVEKGRLQIPDTHIASQQLLYMLQGESQFCRMLGIDRGPDEIQAREYIDACVELFLRAFQPDRS